MSALITSAPMVMIAQGIRTAVEGMRAILSYPTRHVAWLMLAALMVMGGCGMTPERAQEPERPMTPPGTLASLHQPDIYIQQMRLTPGDRELFIVVGNKGGTLGLLDTDETRETYGDVIAHLRITVTMLICANGWDRGEEDFVCESPSHRIRHFGMGPVPIANTFRYRTVRLYVPSAWQLHVMVEPQTGVGPDAAPVIEIDFPGRWNNQAVMKLVMHPSRESWRGGAWYWPNSVDSLHF